MESALLLIHLLLAAVFLVARFGRTAAVLDLGSRFGTLALNQRIELIGGLVALAVVAGIIWLLWHILRQQGRLLLRIEVVESRLGESGLADQAGSAMQIGPEIGQFVQKALQVGGRHGNVDVEVQGMSTVPVELPAMLAMDAHLNAGNPGNEPVMLAYLIVAHYQPEHVGRLIRALNDGKSHFFIHVDAKTDLPAFQAVVAQFDNVAFTSRRVPVEWGRFSVVQAVLNLIQMAATSGHPFRYYTLLSGSDYPIKHKQVIRDRFRNSNHQFIRIDRRLTVDPENTHAPFLQDLPDGTYFGNMIPYHGSMYWSLTAECIHFILDFIEKNPGFLQIHHHVFAPDEVFFHTLLKYSPFADAITQDFSAGRYPNHTHHGNHFIDWAGIRKRDPRLVLDERDFDDLLASDALFARKFDQHESSRLLDLLDTYVHSPLTPFTAAPSQERALASTQAMEAERGRSN